MRGLASSCICTMKFQLAVLVHNSVQTGCLFGWNADLDEGKGLVHYGAVICGGAALDKNNIMK